MSLKSAAGSRKNGSRRGPEQIKKLKKWIFGRENFRRSSFDAKSVNFKSVNFCCPAFLTRHSGTDIMNNCLIQTDEIL